MCPVMEESFLFPERLVELGVLVEPDPAERNEVVRVFDDTDGVDL